MNNQESLHQRIYNELKHNPSVSKQKAKDALQVLTHYDDHFSGGIFRGEKETILRAIVSTELYDEVDELETVPSNIKVVKNNQEF